MFSVTTFSHPISQFISLYLPVSLTLSFPTLSPYLLSIYPPLSYSLLFYSLTLYISHTYTNKHRHNTANFETRTILISSETIYHYVFLDSHDMPCHYYFYLMASDPRRTNTNVSFPHHGGRSPIRSARECHLSFCFLETLLFHLGFSFFLSFFLSLLVYYFNFSLNPKEDILM